MKMSLLTPTIKKYEQCQINRNNHNNHNKNSDMS